MRSRALALTGILSVTAICLIGNMDRVRADSTTQPAASQPATTTAAALAIAWDEGAKHVGELVTVTGPVAGTHMTAGNKALLLNLGKDYPDTTRFTVFISLTDKDKVSEDSYKGKTVTATGKIILYKKAPEIKVSLSDVTIEP